MMIKRKLDGAVEEFSADCGNRKFDATVHNLWKIWKPASRGTAQAGWVMKFGRHLKF